MAIGDAAFGRGNAVASGIMVGVRDHQDFVGDLYHEYSDRIYRFLVWQTSDARLAEDLTAEVFLRSWKHRTALASVENQQAWLYRVAKNLVIDHWRKQHTAPLDDADRIAAPLNLAGEAQAGDDARYLRSLVAALPEDMKTVIILRFFEHLSGEEVSKIMGKSQVNVRVLQYRALKILKRRYGAL